MNVICFSLTLLVAVVVSGGPAWKDQNVQRGAGLKIGQQNVSKSSNSSRGNGLKVGGFGRVSRSTTTTQAPPEEYIHTPSTSSSPGIRPLYVGLVVPYKSFGAREYTKAVTTTKNVLVRKLVNMFKLYELQYHTVMKELTPSPRGTLTKFSFSEKFTGDREDAPSINYTVLWVDCDEDSP
ncbi:hypothetical protein QE152_g33344 [Popillia japonica]|uniref:Uncharacterized protein n=1 Tax=Popillia japonica TaxID=7064 RepID=A0AAW1IX57_POPJA